MVTSEIFIDIAISTLTSHALIRRLARQFLLIMIRTGVVSPAVKLEEEYKKGNIVQVLKSALQIKKEHIYEHFKKDEKASCRR